MAEIQKILRDVAAASNEGIAFLDSAGTVFAQSRRFLAMTDGGFDHQDKTTWSRFEVVETALDGGFSQLSVSWRVRDEFFVEALDKLLDPVMIINADGIVEWTNVEEQQDTVGQRYLDVLDESYRDVAAEHLDRVMNLKQTIACEPAIVMAGEHRLWFRGRMVPIFEDDQLRHIAIFAQDITDHMEAVASLELSEARYRMLLSNASEMLLVFTTDMRLRYASENAPQFLGFEDDERLPESPLAYVHAEDTAMIRENFERTIGEHGSQRRFDARIRQKDGTFADFELRMQLVSLDEDESVVLVAARDVTQQREAEQLRRGLIRADKLAAIGQLAAGVAHEINNPATFIYTNLYILKDYAQEFMRMNRELTNWASALPGDFLKEIQAYNEDNEIQHLLDDMERMIDTNLEGMDRISMIVKDLRTFSRDDSDELGPVDINEAIESASNMIRNHANHVSRLDLDLQEVPVIFADHGKLTQVMMNLLMNAVHSVSDQPEPNVITVRSRTDADSVQIEVEDTGTGIDPSLHEIIWQPFFTTKPPEQGTGLGLWLCREIVEKNRGDIEFDTVVGEGTVFRLTFPTSAPSFEHIPTMLGDEISNVSPARILMIDDDELVLRAYDHALGREHELVLAHGGSDGLETLAKDPHFDLVVCDLVMPKVDGPEVYTQISENHPHLLDRLIFCTAGATTTRTRKFIERSDVRIVSKPITPNQLHKFVHSMTQESEKGAAAALQTP